VARPHRPLRRGARRAADGNRPNRARGARDRRTQRSNAMTVTNVVKDTDALTLAITAEFDAPVDRVWELWQDPRQLERWWGPPPYPATFVEPDLRPGGKASYYMPSPEGEKFHGWWEFATIDAPHRIVIEDGFADDSGARNDNLPITRMQVDIEERDGG